MMETKVVKKTFGIAEFTEEEKWLEEQHKNGWQLFKTNRNTYHFEKGISEEWIYQLDFKENGVAEEDYLQMFKDLDWEYVAQHDNWCYFRKKKEDNTDLTIFSDRDSKLDMYTKILQNRHLKATIILFVIACIIEWLTFFTDAFKGSGFADGAMPWIGIGLFVACSFPVSQYIKLKKMAEELKFPE